MALDNGIIHPNPPDHDLSVYYEFDMGAVGLKLSINVIPKFHGVIPGLSRDGWRQVMEELESKWVELAQRHREERT